MIAIFRIEQLKVWSCYLMKEESMKEKMDQGKDYEYSFGWAEFEIFHRYTSVDVELDIEF